MKRSENYNNKFDIPHLNGNFGMKSVEYSRFNDIGKCERLLFTREKKNFWEKILNKNEFPHWYRTIVGNKNIII